MNVVIGGGSGIGATVAELLAGETVIADRAGGDIACDLTDSASLVELARQVDRLDALVVTAGISPAMSDAQTIFDVDLAGMARVLQAFDSLVETGSIAVCVASLAGHLGTWPPETLAALDDPLTSPEANLTDDSATAYVLAKLGCHSLGPKRGFPLGKSRRADLVGVAGCDRHANGCAGAFQNWWNCRHRGSKRLEPGRPSRGGCVGNRVSMFGRSPLYDRGRRTRRWRSGRCSVVRLDVDRASGRKRIDGATEAYCRRDRFSSGETRKQGAIARAKVLINWGTQ
jgi:hypothetical protein